MGGPDFLICETRPFVMPNSFAAWDKERERWTAEATVGYQPNGKRIVRRGRGKTAAKDKLKQILRDYEDGLTMAADAVNYTVRDAVEDWLKYGLPGRSAATRAKVTNVAHVHVIPALGARKLRDLATRDVDRWLESEATQLSTRSLCEVRAVLKRAVSRAQAQDRVKRNVVELAEVPEGRDGRRSRSLTLAQANTVLKASERSPLHAYVVVSLLTGARTEEMRELRWDQSRPDRRPHGRPADPATRWSGAPSGRKRRPRPRGPAARSPCPRAPSTRSRSMARHRTFGAARRTGSGGTTTWSSARTRERRWTRPTSADSSGPLSTRLD